METCKTCRWWTGTYTTEDAARLMRERVAKSSDCHSLCGHEKVSATAWAHSDGCSDFDGYSGVVTGPDFGCIHHEPKE